MKLLVKSVVYLTGCSVSELLSKALGSSLLWLWEQDCSPGALWFTQPLVCAVLAAVQLLHRGDSKVVPIFFLVLEFAVPFHPLLSMIEQLGCNAWFTLLCLSTLWWMCAHTLHFHSVLSTADLKASPINPLKTNLWIS